MDAPKLPTPTTLQAAIEFFAEESRAHAYLTQQRWPDGRVTCPTCGRPDVLWLANQRRWKCRGKHPRPQFSVKAGTIFEDSPLPLKHWMLATWMISNCKNGISSYELHRALGVTQKTAWFMNHRIRLAMHDTAGGRIGGPGETVEIDETYIGGKARNMHKAKRATAKGRTWAGKVAVMGLLQRHSSKGRSKVQTTVVPHTRRVWLQSEIVERVDDGATVYTDELKSYIGLDQNYTHQVINHAEKYVDGNVHTNGLENFWSLLKRAIKGTYVSVEPFHLFRYLDEQAYRFNERAGTDGERFDRTLSQVAGRRVQYKELTGETPIL